MKYQIKPVTVPVKLDAEWDAECWKNIEALRIVNARCESSNHRPQAELKMQYDSEGIYGLFQVKDYYVKSVYTGFQ